MFTATTHSIPLPDTDTLARQFVGLFRPRTATLSPTHRAVARCCLEDTWLAQRFSGPLRLTTGELVTVVNPGILTPSRRPAVSAAQVETHHARIEGPVVLHATTGDWYRQRCHLNPAFNAAILHVTLMADAWTGGLLRPNGSPLPEVVIGPLLPLSIRAQLCTFLGKALAA